MVLSTGTLNLKFMQRAAARASKDEPPQAVSASASPAPASPAVSAAAPSPGPATEGKAAATDEAEAGAKWVLPRRTRNAEAGPSKTPRVQFVASYMPFLDDDDDQSPGGGPGRFSFSIGKRAGGGTHAGEGDEDEDMGSSDEDEGATARKKPVKDLSRGRFFKDTGKKSAGDKDKGAPMARTVSRQDEHTPEPEDIPRTFQRPRGFSPSGDRPPKSTTGKASPASVASSKKQRRGQDVESEPGPSSSRSQHGDKAGASSKARSQKLSIGNLDDESLSENASRALSIDPDSPNGSASQGHERRNKSKSKTAETKSKGGLMDKIRAKVTGSSREPSSSPASSRGSTPASTPGKKRERSADEDTDGSSAKRPKRSKSSGGKGGADGLGRTLDERAANLKKQKQKNKKAGKEDVAAGKPQTQADTKGSRKEQGKSKSKGRFL